MLSLPIDSLKAQFESLIQNEHLVVEAETGSGKSTRLPVWAANYGRVLVIEPRRIACTSLAGFLAQESGEPLGQAIGYAIKLDSKFSDDTNVVFVTPGVALRWLAEDGLVGFDTIIVDEFHERRWDIDVLVALLKKKASHRLVITSATIEGDKLARYINGSRLQSEGRRFDVELHYRCRDSRDLPDSRDIERKVAQEVELQLAQSSHDILVFLPGRKEITLCAQALNKLDGIKVVKLHGSVTDEERQLALTVQSERKVVLATNVAETSLTIPNIEVVIDTGLERRTVQRNGRTALALKAISLASAKQRAGRAGRVMEGKCVRLYGQHAALELVTPPELQREELIEPMLASASSGYPIEQLEFLDLLPTKSLDSAKEKLLLMEAIDQDGIITEHGKALYPLPVDALYADLVTRVQPKALKEAMIDLAAALSVPAALYQLPKSSESIEELVKSIPEQCDATILIKLVRGYELPHLSIDIEAIKEAQGLARQMRELFELPMLEVASRYQRDDLLTAMMTLQPQLVFVRRVKRRDALSNGKLEVQAGRQSLLNERAEAALVLDTHSLPGRGIKQTLTLATVNMPVPLRLLVELEFGEWQQGETIAAEGEVATQLHLMYAGRAIAEKCVTPEGQLALKPIVDMVLDNHVLPGLVNERSAEIKHWQMHVALGLSETSVEGYDTMTFESWFIEQLEMLGVETLDDLVMFANDDFEFEGIPYWEYDDFAEKYPFELNLGDLQLSVEYYAKRKLIYVVHQSGLRKTVPKRWELPTWQGWKIQYKKASRIVDIK
ncbi:ATP-dependent RNA helicase [Vibrio sp. T187]|uniref:helicase-related protein n=1 Tax=Vibrio TaxID=662 RepID=UPI0010C940B0|nr:MULTISPECIES: helicase-related protein [Vibrio]MBW3696809.1 ATP-dependent RNA helicase [Vibrio sp. T187]